MRPRVLIRTDDGLVHELGHGDLIGRLWSAALHVDDPWVSEAHALVSLRGDALHLLALRGRLAVGDAHRDHVRLDPGVVVRLSPEVKLEVIDVRLPSEALALEAPGLGRRVLHGTCGLVARPTPAIVALATEGVDAVVWRSATGWRVRVGTADARALHGGDVIELVGATFTAVDVPIASVAATRQHATPSLRLVARYDSVHVLRDGTSPLVVGGMPARLLSELVRFGTPVPWALLADELWRDAEADPAVQRRRLDATVARLRARLAEGDVRPDLVRATGAGHLELVLHPGDHAEDQT